MPRYLDLICSKCGEEVVDFFVMTVPRRIVHWPCHAKMEQVFRPRRRTAQWCDRDAVVVFRKPDGTYSYPGRNDVATPAGCERVVMRDLRTVERFERENGVRNEAMHYDRGSGNGAEDDTPHSPAAAFNERYRRFREAWGG